MGYRSVLEAEEIIRQLQIDEPERFDYIQNLPNGLRSAKADNKGAVFVLCEAVDRQGETQYRRIYLVDSMGQFITSDLQEILQRLKTMPDTPKQSLPSNFNQLVSAIQAEFESEVETRQSELKNTNDRSLGRKFVLQELQLIHDSAKDTEIRKVANYLAQLFANTSLPRRCHNELNVLKSKKLRPEQLLEQLKRIARDFGLANASQRNQASAEHLVVRIVCSEALI
jgi:hypothetical protein